MQAIDLGVSSSTLRISNLSQLPSQLFMMPNQVYLLKYTICETAVRTYVSHARVSETKTSLFFPEPRFHDLNALQ